MSEPSVPITSLGTVRAFLKKGTCSEALFHVLDKACGHPMPLEEHAGQLFAGGIVQHGYQCGQVWGAALSAGAQAHRRFGAGATARTAAILAAGRLVDAFRQQNNAVDCYDITAVDKRRSALWLTTYFLIKGGTIGCLRMAARYAPAAFRAIESALSEEPADVPPAPVSCAACLVERMGGTEAQADTAAGLAGGIGLSGGACGALGAALWYDSVKRLDTPEAKIPFKDLRTLSAIERFLKVADYQFECSAIVGRRFDSVGDHAAYIGQGGCSAILDALVRSG